MQPDLEKQSQVNKSASPVAVWQTSDIVRFEMVEISIFANSQETHKPITDVDEIDKGERDPNLVLEVRNIAQQQIYLFEVGANSAVKY